MTLLGGTTGSACSQLSTISSTARRTARASEALSGSCQAIIRACRLCQFPLTSFPPSPSKNILIVVSIESTERRLAVRLSAVVLVLTNAR